MTKIIGNLPDILLIDVITMAHPLSEKRIFTDLNPNGYVYGKVSLKPEAMFTRLLLGAGLLSSLLYAFMLAFVPQLWEGYSSSGQMVSELSAIGAPTRQLWVSFGVVYAMFVMAFGWGVIRWSAGKSRALGIAGFLLAVYGAIVLFWPPMHLRGTELTQTDSLHVAFTVAAVLLILLAIGFAAAKPGKWFRLYSFVTMVALLVFGTLAGTAAPRLSAGLPTPGMGVWERFYTGAFLLWIAVLSVILLLSPEEEAEGSTPEVQEEESRRSEPEPAGFL